MLRILGPHNTLGEELIVTVPAAKSWTLQSLSGVMDGTDTMQVRTLIISLLSTADAGNDLFRDVLVNENGPISDILFCAAVGMATKRRDNLGNPYIINPLPAISLPAAAVMRFETNGGAGIHELFILVDET